MSCTFTSSCYSECVPKWISLPSKRGFFFRGDFIKGTDSCSVTGTLLGVLGKDLINSKLISLRQHVPESWGGKNDHQIAARSDAEVDADSISSRCFLPLTGRDWF